MSIQGHVSSRCSENHHELHKYTLFGSAPSRVNGMNPLTDQHRLTSIQSGETFRETIEKYPLPSLHSSLHRMSVLLNSELNFSGDSSNLNHSIPPLSSNTPTTDQFTDLESQLQTQPFYKHFGRDGCTSQSQRVLQPILGHNLLVHCNTGQCFHGDGSAFLPAAQRNHKFSGLAFPHQTTGENIYHPFCHGRSSLFSQPDELNVDTGPFIE